MYDDAILKQDEYKDEKIKLSKDHTEFIDSKNKLIQEKEAMIKDLLVEKASHKTQLASKDTIINNLKEHFKRLEQKFQQRNLKTSTPTPACVTPEDKMQEELREIYPLKDKKGKLSHEFDIPLKGTCSRKAAIEEVPQRITDPETQFKALRQANTAPSHNNFSLFNMPLVNSAPANTIVEGIRYERIPEGKQNAGCYKQDEFKVINVDGKSYRITNILQPLILQISGEPMSDTKTIEDQTYNRYIENGKEKLVTKPCYECVVEFGGRFYSKRTMLKEFDFKANDSP